MPVKTFTYSNCTVRVHVPDLTKDERKKKQQELHKAVERFFKAVEKEKQ